MFEVEILCVGRPKWSEIETMLAEYAKRLSHECKVLWRFAKDEKQLHGWVSDLPCYIALVIEGKSLSSMEFKNFFIDHLLLKKRIAFVIGPDKGLDPAIIQKAVLSLSLSRLTFTHELTRLVLMEQIYRSFQIHQNSPYHK